MITPFLSSVSFLVFFQGSDADSLRCWPKLLYRCCWKQNLKELPIQVSLCILGTWSRRKKLTLQVQTVLAWKIRLSYGLIWLLNTKHHVGRLKCNFGVIVFPFISHN
ncbi:hypothetical protein POPTR_004G170350v4 [Populus trichocarpa]|uniref:Secreted protein n=1 Tax=Populus trichocarpa TaxID=3694 RepID=A0A3N7FSD4_POPTR|nr:hypothetical protein POPTR_004G170350v4 [Populus trichocarpa]